MTGLLFSSAAFALEDNFQKAVEKAAAANKVQSERIKMITENIANEQSTATKPNEDPYVRQVMFVENKFDRKLGTKLLKVKRVKKDKKTPFKYKYEPHHPAADQNGYVKYPNIDKNIERADASEAKAIYEATLTLIETSNSLTKSTLDLLEK